MSSRSTLLALVSLLLAGGAIAVLLLRSPAPTTGVDATPALIGAASTHAEEQLTATPLASSRLTAELQTTPDEPEVEERWLPLHIVAKSGRRHDAAPAAGISVIAGVGPAFGPDVQPLATGTTDAEGVCDLRVPWAAAEAARADGERVWVRPVGEGWSRKTSTRQLPEAPELIEIELVVEAGFTLYGLLLGEHGEPITGSVSAAGVTLLGKSTSAIGSVGSDGRFELHFTAAGTYDVVGDSSRRFQHVRGSVTYAGVGSLRGVVVSETEQPDDLVLQLAGSGVIRGRVETASGQPVAGLDLYLNSTWLAEGERGSLAKYLSLRAEGRGAPAVEIRTDADGRFEVRGLRPESFEATVDNGQTRLNRAPLPSDGEPVVLVLDYTHLVVRPGDDAGEPWDGALGSSWYEAPEEWPALPRITVVPTSGNLAASTWDSYGPLGLVEGKSIDTTAWSFEVEPGGEYLVGLLGGPGTWAPTVVRVPAAGGRVEVELRSGPTREIGTLSLSVTDASGPIVDDIVVQVEDLDTGVPLLSKSRFYDETWPLELRLPAGSYRLAVEGRPSFDTHGTLLSSSDHGRFEADFAIAPENATSLVAHLPAGARIDLLLTLLGDEPLEPWPLGARVAQVRLLSEERWPRVVDFPVAQLYGRTLAEYLAPGARQTSELLPAGRFVLEARAPGGRVASVPVTLVDGETLSVTLEL